MLFVTLVYGLITKKKGVDYLCSCIPDFNSNFGIIHYLI